VHRTAFALTTLAALAAACSSAPKPATPAPEAAAAPRAAGAAVAAPAAERTLAGEWDFRLNGSSVSTIRFARRGAGYVGVLEPLQRVSSLPESSAPPGGYQVRSATVQGDRAIIIIDFDGDDGRIDAAFRGPNTLDGVISSRRLSGRIMMQRR
jgi:hypothetical protein